MHQAWLRFTVATLRCRVGRLIPSILTVRRACVLRRLVTIPSGGCLPTSHDCSTSSPRLQTRLQRRWWDDGAAILVHCRIDQDALEEHLIQQLLQAIRRRQVQPVAVLQEVERLDEVLLHQSGVGRVAVQFALDRKDAAGQLLLFLLEKIQRDGPS